jgi:predicted kinase
MAGTFIIMMGIQGSGKSTFCDLFLADGYDRLNTYDKARAAFDGGADVILDAINDSRAERAACISAAKATGYRVIGYCLERAVEDCAASSKASRDAIYATLESFEMPEIDEGYDELYRVENDGEIMAICPWGEQDDEFFDCDFV